MGQRKRDSVYLEEPRLVKDVLANPTLAWVWIVPRLFLGFEWIESSLRKLDDPAWMNTGSSLKSLWLQAHANASEGGLSAGLGWYSRLMQYLVNGHHYIWCAKLIAVGELLLGVMLILGAFTGLAALAGMVMNWNYMLAGTVGVNPLLLLLSVALILGWRTAGYWGLDRWLLPAIGAPWRSGKLFSIRVRPVDKEGTDTYMERGSKSG